MTLITPLLLGLAGSLHCVGMCGPLLLAFPVDASGRWPILGRMLTYHAGRILTYAALGLLFGLLGQGVALAGFQQGLSVAAGIFMLTMAFAAWRAERLVKALPGFGAFTRWVQGLMGKLLRQHPGGATFSVGLLNGLLPCGMVYAALAGAISTTGGTEGSVFMALFGLGTLPLLLAVSVFGRALSLGARQKIRFVQPVLLTVAGLLLLHRGLQLDLSLFEAAVPGAQYECH